MFAHDPSWKDVRTFALPRVSKPRLTGERFTKPEKFSPKKYLEDSLGVMKGKGDFEVVIQFDSWGSDLVQGRKWHESQEFRELSDGGSELRMRLSGLEEIERSVLSWGTHATVVKPKALADRVRKTAEELVRRYAG